ncbi:MAG: hypothetical protein J6J21_03225 [Clostridia bacterium]|nr:hypothetical protein [Clostridia bacterium]
MFDSTFFFQEKEESSKEESDTRKRKGLTSAENRAQTTGSVLGFFSPFLFEKRKGAKEKPRRETEKR